MSNRRSALFVFGLALVASVATSPIRWQLYEEAEGARVIVDDTAPIRSLFIDLDSTDIPAEAWSDLVVSIDVQQTVDAEDAPLTLDFVLVEETRGVDVEIQRISAWTLAAPTEENPAPERVVLSAWDIGRTGTWRIDVERISGVAATLDWTASAWFEVDGVEEVPGEPTATLLLDPVEP